MTKEMIDRINELYHKSQSEGLTPEEKEEQQKLRKLYIQTMSSNFTAQLDRIDIQNPDGTIENLGEKYGKKQNPS